jgi:hypothetical protein
MTHAGGRTDAASGDKVWTLDFSDVRTPGRYEVRSASGKVRSGPFEISETVYRPVLREALRTFYYQRAGFAKTTPHADGRFTDEASHIGRGQDREARRFLARTDARTARDMSGGWYDAGDFNQYTYWTAAYIPTLLHAYEESPSAFGDDFGLPESGNGRSDLIDEVLWGLAWLERMQREDGAVFSVLGRDSASPPSAARGPSTYGDVSTAASLASASAFALSAIMLEREATLKGSPQAGRLKARALRAWAWAEKYPDVQFFNNDARYGTEGLAAGQQEPDAATVKKTRLAAAIYLYILTGEKRFAHVIESAFAPESDLAASPADPYAYDMQDALVFLASRRLASPALQTRIKQKFRTCAPSTDAYHSPLAAVHWGSNQTKARAGTVCQQAFFLNGGSINAKAAGDYLHYLHGANPLGLVYLTRMEHAGAERSAQTLYHVWFADGSRWDGGADKLGPPPGFLTGGPNPGYQPDACCPSSCGSAADNRQCSARNLYPPLGQPAYKSYADFNEGWPLNSWQISENSNAYQAAYIRLLASQMR